MKNNMRSASPSPLVGEGRGEGASCNKGTPLPNPLPPGERGLRGRVALILPLVFLLGGCVSEWDMQGTDPKDFLAAHPQENTVVLRELTFAASFEPSAPKLSHDALRRLRGDLREVSPEAAEDIMVELSAADMKNAQRRDHLNRIMHAMNYAKAPVKFKKSEMLTQDEARFHVSYLAVVPPECLNWRMSPVTTYSNTAQANFGCAHVTNLGLMVADPRDLNGGSGERGRGDTVERRAKVLQDYRGGKDFGAAPASAQGSAVAAGTSGLTGGQ